MVNESSNMIAWHKNQWDLLWPVKQYGWDSVLHSFDGFYVCALINGVWGNRLGNTS